MFLVLGLLFLAAAWPAGAAEAEPLHSSSHGPHAHEPLKAREHADLMSLVPTSQATHTVQRSGTWTDSETWSSGVVPPTGARVHVPDGSVLLLDSRLDDRRFEWVRIDGELRFSTVADTVLQARTVVVGPSGRLRIGSPDDRVRPEFSARIRLLDRGPRDRNLDPADLAGGLLVHGEMRIFGALRTVHRIPVAAVSKGQSVILFDEPVVGWRPGDQLLIPGVSLGKTEDEVIAIAAVGHGGRQVRLRRPLAFDHRAPARLGLRVPVGNLTRNVVIESEHTKHVSRRAHVMIMHKQTGTIIDGAALVGLGRTDASIAHTTPVPAPDGLPVAGTDRNSIGRYALHFHVRSGARADVAPHRVHRSVVVDSPKHGIVNHGAHLIASENITYRVAGSHFFAENGTEIGAFRGNLAVRSEGSGDAFDSRMDVQDFGHGGHGFWLQGSGRVEVADNFAFGHASGAYFYFGQYIVEDAQAVRFTDAGHTNGSSAAPSGKVTYPRDHPVRFVGNEAAASPRGLEIWNNMEHVPAATGSLVADSSFWNISDKGVFIPYTHGLLLRNVRVTADPAIPRGAGIGFACNSKTRDIRFEQVEAAGFAMGLEVPRQGRNVVHGGTFDNVYNIWIQPPLAPGRTTDFHDVYFKSPPREYTVDYYLEGARITDLGDVSMLFDPDPILVHGGDPRLAGRQLYSPEQDPNAVPFEGTGIPQLDGKTGAEIWRDYALAVGGTLMPARSRSASGVRGFVGPVADGYLPALPASLQPKGRDSYGGNFLTASQAEGLEDGWNFLTVESGGARRTLLVYADRTPPVLVLDERVPLQIHPDDVRFGLRLEGDIIDYVAGVRTVNTVNRSYPDVEVAEDGMVHVTYPVKDAAGNVTEVPYAVVVTENAKRRGQNRSFYLQSRPDLR